MCLVLYGDLGGGFWKLIEVNESQIKPFMHRKGVGSNSSSFPQNYSYFYLLFVLCQGALVRDQSTVQTQNREVVPALTHYPQPMCLIPDLERIMLGVGAQHSHPLPIAFLAYLLRLPTMVLIVCVGKGIVMLTSFHYALDRDHQLSTDKPPNSCQKVDEFCLLGWVSSDDLEMGGSIFCFQSS